MKKQPVIKSLPPFPIGGKIELKKSNLNDIVRSLQGLLPQHIGGSIESRLELADEDLHLMADGTRIGEAIINFVKNAAEAMPTGGTLTISTARVSRQGEPDFIAEYCSSGGCALLSITDTGAGMDKDMMGKIFEPHFTTKPGVGSGLGLPMAHSIIRKHSGCIKVESTPGKGTAIKVYLPLLRTVTRQEKATAVENLLHRL